MSSMTPLSRQAEVSTTELTRAQRLLIDYKVLLRESNYTEYWALPCIAYIEVKYGTYICLQQKENSPPKRKIYKSAVSQETSIV